MPVTQNISPASHKDIYDFSFAGNLNFIKIRKIGSLAVECFDFRLLSKRFLQNLRQIRSTLRRNRGSKVLRYE